MHAQPNLPPVKTLRGHFWAAWKRSANWRPVSVYLLLAIIPFLVLATMRARMLESPMEFAGFIAFNLLFFFVLMAAAIHDAMRILRRGLRESRTIMTETLGDENFRSALRENVAGQPWPEEPDTRR